MEPVINVKHKSGIAFFEEHLVGFKVEDKSNYDQMDGKPSLYHLMKDKLYFKKSEKFIVGETIVIELKDESRNSRQALLNIYKYRVKVYDDISWELELVDFSIKSVKN